MNSEVIRVICQECQKRSATVHFTKIINGEKMEVHLCEQCAHEKGNIIMFNNSSGLSINNLLAGLFNFNPNIEHTHSNAIHPNEIIQCDTCGMTLQQFLKIGRFGCASCYDAFQDQVTPILKRLHGGNWKHIGKIPERSGGTIHLRKKIDILKETLQSLVAKEEFEKAAEVRDEIRAYEKQLQEGGE